MNENFQANSWDIKQLQDEQKLLQPIHEKYLGNKSTFTWTSEVLTPNLSNLLDYKDRVNYGCKLLGYTAEQGCKP
ncbi:MAG: hypothetical protein IJV56_10220 [Neisseriaceae bacterium]|nr:hypothetical protein [Neisseriaceae bacterium]